MGDYCETSGGAGKGLIFDIAKWSVDRVDCVEIAHWQQDVMLVSIQFRMYLSGTTNYSCELKSLFFY